MLGAVLVSVWSVLLLHNCHKDTARIFTANHAKFSETPLTSDVGLQQKVPSCPSNRALSSHRLQTTLFFVNGVELS